MKELAISELIMGREVIIDIEETDADARFKQIIANVQREDVDPIDLGHAFVMLKEKYGYQYNEIAEIIGKTPHYVTSKVGLVKRLAPEVQEMAARDLEASKDEFSSKDEAEALKVNLKIIEDIARLPEEQQKKAYLTIRSKDMPTYEALKYLRSIKKGFTGGPDKKGGPTRALSLEDKPGDDLARYIEKLDQDVDELAGRIQTTVQLNRPEVIQKIEATLEKLSSLYVRLKNEATDGSQPGQVGNHDLMIYGKQECINVRYS
jgi:ParB family chromosome partitioning protein